MLCLQRLIGRAAWIAVGLLFSAAVAGQSYPSRPVKLVVPFPPGSATDAIGRVVAQLLSDDLGQSFIVDNKPGAQATIGAELVARSTPDGYTILVTTNTAQAANVSLFKELRYDPVKDFVPIVRLGTTPIVLSVGRDFPANTMREFIATAKTRKEGLLGGYGTSTSQVAVAMLRSTAGLDVTAIPYKGLPPAMLDVIGGRLDFTFVDLGNAIAQAKDGKLRNLGVTSEKRSTLAPDIPAIAETLPGYNLVSWFALMAPAGTPREVVTKVQEAAIKGLNRPEVQSRLALLGIDAAPLNSEGLARFIDSEVTKWRQLVRDAGIQPE
jgi:tripartite-type tricarboxylate transporter receptor subunit TctC